ncbi:MAG: choice-of-anchor tandem repeat GloVer-containing protein [Acidobacteriota bacterium]
MRKPPAPRTVSTIRRALVIAAAMVAVPIHSAEAQITVAVVHAFPSAGAVQPAARLLRGSDGNFYGTTQYGGSRNAGTVFSLAPDGAFTVLHEFNGLDGAWPNALIEASDGNLYGTTGVGGLGIDGDYSQVGFGTAFRIGFNGTFTSLHLFTGEDSRAPSELVQGTDGLFYGTTRGANSGGTVFRMTPGGTVTNIHVFTYGSSPVFGLIQAGDGRFYGMTLGGCGAVFRITAAGWFEEVHKFGGQFNNCHPVDAPQGPLIVGPGGSILGATTLSIFAIANGTFLSLVNSSCCAGPVFGPLTLGADGTLYSVGFVVDGVAEVSTSAVLTFADGVPSALHAFADAEGSWSRAPLLNALIAAPDGNLYGTAHDGGASNLGTIFRMTPSGDVTVLHDFAAGTEGAGPVAALTQASDGHLYGTNAFGGLFNGGSVFRVSTTGDLAAVHTFALIDGIRGTSPTTPVIEALDGALYGTTPGAAFRVTLGAGTTTFRFPDWNSLTAASLVQANDGRFYGTVTERLFSMTSDGAFAVLHTFSGPDGYLPSAELIQGLDGQLYGSTRRGGASDFGSLFKTSLDGTLTPLYSFAGGADGANPAAPLLQTPDGQLYGTTMAGGGAGTVFKITPSGEYAQLHAFTGGAGGATPTGKLVQATDGNFYGTTTGGGALGLGTIFRITPSGGFLVMHSFSGNDGAHPHGGLTQATDGHLYGTTPFGGPDSDGGVVYRVTLPPCTATLALTYAGGTIAMRFSLASSTPATFSTWLVHQSGVSTLWSGPVPAIAPAVSFNVPLTGFPAIGNVGILTVLNAPGWSGACYDWQVVDTGGAGVGASAETLRNQITRRGLIPKAPR